MSDQNSTALHATIVQAGYTTSDEISLIATNLNVTIFQAFLMGIYTIIFGGTMYIYLTRQPSKRYVVPVSVSVLYICNIADFGLEWLSTKNQFVDNGTTRDTVFMAIDSTPLTIATIGSVLNVISFVLSDALLIWRCFNLWNNSFLVISVPLFLTFAEAALMFVQTIGSAIVPLTSESLQTIFNKVAVAGIVLSACTTIITTILIAYRIQSFLSTQEGVSSKRFRHIIDIVVQSGAVSSLSLLIFGISNIFNTEDTLLNVNAIIFDFWTNAFVFPLTGMSTTIMVARVATLSNSTTIPSTSTNMTGIWFEPRSTVRTGTGAQVSVALNAQDHYASDTMVGESKDEAPNEEKKNRI
ncbi:hypothetical protein BDN70DRAFT_924305 [Pholiota conissans]|uniref:Uncharacterized protein n=1 Tax=Pholiota conissans TaxID=109636 RepID=A0A9P5YSD2_9AGAR|nr:hypothetical protein BDN70DRAFT_924305 [Pholiota conissans]